MQCDAYSKPPDNQLAFDGLDTKGERRMKDARLWVREHLTEWTWYKRKVAQINANGRKASANAMLHYLRDEFGVSIPNVYAPYFSRIAREEQPELDITHAKSAADAYTTAVL